MKKSRFKKMLKKVSIMVAVLAIFLGYAAAPVKAYWNSAYMPARDYRLVSAGRTLSHLVWWESVSYQAGFYMTSKTYYAYALGAEKIDTYYYYHNY